MEEELMKSLRIRQADNANANISAQAVSQSLAAQMTAKSTIFAGNDAKRMSFDGNLPQYNLAQSPSAFGLTSGLTGGAPNFNRDRRDSLKLIAQIQDFGN